METKVIIANAIGFVSFVISLIAFHKKDKKNIFKNTMISNSLSLIQYIVLNAYSGIATKIIAILRDLSIMKQEKYNFLKTKKMLSIFIIIYLVLMIITYQGIISVFSLLAALIYTVFCWNGNVNTVRYIGIFTNVLWLVYDIYVKSYIGAFSNLISIFSTSIAVYNNKIGKEVK